MRMRIDCPGGRRMPGLSDLGSGIAVLAAYRSTGLSNSWVSRPALYRESVIGKEADTRTRLGTKRKSSAVRLTCCVLSQAATRDERNTQRKKPETYRLCVWRSMARFPLDAAADAGLLVGIDQLAGKHGIDGCTQI